MADRFNPNGKKGGGYATITYTNPKPYHDRNNYKNNGSPSNGYDSHNGTNMSHKKELSQNGSDWLGNKLATPK